MQLASEAGPRPDARSRSWAPDNAHPRADSPTDFRVGLESAPDAAIVIDAEGTVVVMNEGAERLFGHMRERLVGKHVEVLLPERFRATHVKRRRGYFADPRTRPMGAGLELAGLRADGTEFPIDISLSAVQSEDGSFLAMAFIRDISDRQAAREALLASEARFRALLDSAPDAALVIDTDGRIVLVNEQTELVFGYSRDELVGKHVEVLLPDRFRGAHVGHRRRYVADPRRRPMGAGLELAGRCKDGREFPVDISLSSIVTEDAGTLAMAFIRDISKRRAAEDALAAANDEVARRAAELERRNNEIVLVSEMGHLLQSCTTSAEANDIIARFARRLFADVDGSILVCKPGSLLEPVASWGQLGGLQATLGASDCWAMRRGVAHAAGEGLLTPVCAHVGADARDYICVPMMAQSQSMGVVHLRARRNGESAATARVAWEATCGLATTMAEHVALALANFELRETLREQSVRDPLTDLFNRRFLSEYVERELRRARRNGASLSIALVDIDRFKDLNDRAGHGVGDAVLVGLAQMLRHMLRGGDIAARTGGDEFVVVFPDCSLIDAARRTEELVAEVRHRSFSSAAHHVTVSAGVAGFPLHGTSLEVMLRGADSALYEAKRAGRDRVEVEPVGDEWRDDVVGIDVPIMVDGVVRV